MQYSISEPLSISNTSPHREMYTMFFTHLSSIIIRQTQNMNSYLQSAKSQRTLSISKSFSQRKIKFYTYLWYSDRVCSIFQRIDARTSITNASTPLQIFLRGKTVFVTILLLLLVYSQTEGCSPSNLMGQQTLLIEIYVKLPWKTAILAKESLQAMYFSKWRLICLGELNYSMRTFLLESLMRARSSAKVNLLFFTVGVYFVGTSTYASLDYYFNPPHSSFKYPLILSLNDGLEIYLFIQKC